MAERIPIEQILVREMREEDIPTIVEIERTSFSMPWSETSFLNELRKPRAVSRVAVLNGIVVGHLCAQTAADEGHILNLAVRADYRQKGIATALVENIIEELKLRACRYLYLEVRASNYAARRLYQGFGFRIVGTRKKYYVAPTEDAIIMMLEI